MFMRRLLLFSLAALLLLPAAATPAVPLPPGAANSDSLEYLGQVGAPGSSRASSTRSGAATVLITTGRFGFRTYDVSDPANPKLLDTFQPPDMPRRQNRGYWQDEDMDIDTRRKLIIGALDPRHDDDPPGPVPRHRERRRARRR